MSKVSIIIPTYNYARFIPFTLQSILSQTYKNFEVIVVDDGSTDNTKQAIKKFSSRIIYIKHSSNKGISKAMNTGIKASGAEYINITQADDLMLANFLQEEVEILDNNPQVGLVYSPVLLIDEQGKEKGKQKIRDISKNNIYLQLLLGNFICLGSILARKTLVEDVGLFNEKLSQFEDWELWLRIAQKSKIAYIPKYLTVHREHSHTLTSKAKRNFERLGWERKIVLNNTIKNNIPSVLKLWFPLLFLDTCIDATKLPKPISKITAAFTLGISIATAKFLKLLYR